MWRTASSAPRMAASRAAIWSAIWFDAEATWWATATVIVVPSECVLVCGSGDRCAADRFSDRASDGRVEDARHDEAGVQLVGGDLVGDGLRRCGQHGVGDVGASRVEKPAEEAREGDDVVDLVGVVAPARGHDSRVLLSL